MRKLLAVLAVALAIPTMSFADDAEPVDAEEFCPVFGEYASMIMRLRLTPGTTISYQLGRVNQLFADPELQKVFKMMVLDAYEEVEWITDEQINRATNEFRNKWELYCYKDLF